MRAGEYNLYIEQGATFEQIIKVTNLDLTQYNPRGQIKEQASSALIVDFTFVVNSATQMTISLTAVQTAALPATGKAYNDTYQATYDIELAHKTNSTVIRFLNGYVAISPEVTK